MGGGKQETLIWLCLNLFEMVAHVNTNILCLNIVVMDEETGFCHTDSYSVACFISFDLLVKL